MPIFFNNCRRYTHAEEYKSPDAFYDLNCTGKQALMVTDLKKGVECVVATPDADGDIEFVWFSFREEKRTKNRSGQIARVFFGKRLKSRTLAKTTAAKTQPYSVLFDVTGRFKRLCVVEPMY